MLRQPIISVLGHVDHGKTTLLDKIRNSAIAAKESGGMTQHIGASEVPLSAIQPICKDASDIIKFDLNIPGLLFIDTPGHDAFTNLRRRGGSIADLAILVVDINKGFEDQTFESFNILKEYKTPFVVAANKIDTVTGWISSNTLSFLKSFNKQSELAKKELNNKIYSIMTTIYQLGMDCDLFYNIKDFTKTLSIIPVSAKTGEGLAELMLLVSGLAQRFLSNRLDINLEGPAKGVIIERKQVKGAGTAVDVIIYDGNLSVNDTVAFATDKSIETSKVKAIMKPSRITDIRIAYTDLISIKKVYAAAGVRLYGNNFDNALPGSPIIKVIDNNYESFIKAEIKDVFRNNRYGVIVKADSIGSLEAVSKLLDKSNIPIKRSSIGNIVKNDIIEAFSQKADKPEYAIVLGFNVDIEKDAANEAAITNVKVIKESIIYKLIDSVRETIEANMKNRLKLIEESVTLPGKLLVLPNSCFRVSKPAIFGVHIIQGRIKKGYKLIDSKGRSIGSIRDIQSNNSSVAEARFGEDVAISIDGVTFGRQIDYNDILYTDVSDNDYFTIKDKLSSLLSDEELKLLDEIREIKKNGSHE
ncbi:MAG: putative translation initiation factor IF-2 [Candidatus Micrarchaeota archaeon]|nr:MAG: putative translation initiation factor IF-2 [Candidatus Micrarchaeota archaeon]